MSQLVYTLIYHLSRRGRVFTLAEPCFWTSEMAVSAGSSLISHSYREILYIRSVGRRYELLWVWLIILWRLRHQQKCAWAPLPIGEHRINKFQSVPEMQGAAAFAAPTHTLQKSGRCLGLKIYTLMCRDWKIKYYYYIIIILNWHR